MVDAGSDELPNVGKQAECGGRIDLKSLVRDYYQSVYRYAYRLCGRQADAEDLVQQTYLLAQQKLHQVREADKVDRWLYAIARSCFLKALAKNRMALVDSCELIVEDVAESLRQSRAFDAEELQLALNELPAEYRLIVVMFYFDDLSYKEIAQQLDVPMGTVMSRLARAKSRLREKLVPPEPAFVGKG